MAYCKECGAYIPDGQEICLACGYDPNKKKREKGKGGFAYEFDSAALKEELEKQRQRIKEESRKWAEQEAARRKTEREQSSGSQNQTGRTKAAPEPEANRQGNLNLLSSVSYLGALFLIPWFFAGQNPYARFHARQGLKLFIFGIVSDVVAALVPVGWLLTLARLYFIYKGMSSALNGRMEPLPYIGNIGEK